MELVETTLSRIPTHTALREALKIVGRRCLEVRQDIRLDAYVRGADEHREALVTASALSQQTWDPDGSSLCESFEPLHAAVAPLSSFPALALITLLEGICRGAGRSYFRATSGIERIERGMVLPLPDRHIVAWPATPNPATTHNVLLDPTCGFLIWDSDWSLELDYTFRDRVEEICWPKTGQVIRDKRVHRLPSIATVHPFTGDEMASPDVMAQGRFFGVHPKTGPDGPSAQDNARRVTDLLAEIGAAADIAIVPEFALHSPDALETALDDGQQRPPIIVAGSAHCSSDGIDANTSITYLDAVPILKSSKRYPFVYRVAQSNLCPPADPTTIEATGGVTHMLSYTEQITPCEEVMRFVSSDSTRLAVVICSDLNSVELFGVLNAAGVNLLLCPAWTPKVGTFAGALEGLAAYSQCLSVIANTPGHPSAPQNPFWAISMTPREGARPVLHRPISPEARAGVGDANEAPEDAPPYWKWL